MLVNPLYTECKRRKKRSRSLSPTTINSTARESSTPAESRHKERVTKIGNGSGLSSEGDRKIAKLGRYDDKSAGTSRLGSSLQDQWELIKVDAINKVEMFTSPETELISKWRHRQLRLVEGTEQVHDGESRKRLQSFFWNQGMDKEAKNAQDVKIRKLIDEFRTNAKMIKNGENNGNRHSKPDIKDKMIVISADRDHKRKEKKESRTDRKISKILSSNFSYSEFLKGMYEVPTFSKRKPQKRYKPIIIDGNSVAYTYGGRKYFNCNGLRKAVDHFVEMGCDKVIVVTPPISCIPKEKLRNEKVLKDLALENRLKRCEPCEDKEWNPKDYDERVFFHAMEHMGVVISNHSFDKLRALKNRLYNEMIAYSTIGFRFAPGLPSVYFLLKDRRGRSGQKLEDLLRIY